MDNVEVMALVVVALVVVDPVEEEVGMQHLETEAVTLTAMEKVLENKRKCLNHTTLGNTRWTLMTLSKNRSLHKHKRISRMQRR